MKGRTVAVLDLQQFKGFNKDDFPHLFRFTVRMYAPERPVLNREDLIDSIKASLSRPEVSNVILLGDAGTGKTSVVTEMIRTDTQTLYLEIDLAKMGAEGSNAMAGYMKGLTDEVISFQSKHHIPLVLFMDEFHQLITLSAPAVEAIKPLLAKSGTYNIKIIAATTLEEYMEFVMPNEALNQRLQRINVNSPDRATIVKILDGMKNRYAPHVRVAPGLYDLIVDYTERYLPSQKQPRKSILQLDAMLGWHKLKGYSLNKQLLDKVIYESTGINANWDVDVKGIESYLRSRVMGQDLAIRMLMARLNVSLANLTDDTKPQGSFLFSGATGVGKTELAKALAFCLFGSERSMIRFDMSEYAEENMLSVFRERLTEKVWANPYSVILLDEIEKGHSSVTRLLLQVLDDARLSNRHGREVVFNNAYIILTTNVGQEAFETIAKINRDEHDEDLTEYMDVIIKALRSADGFPPELINRFDTIVPFNPLNENSRRTIAKIQLKKLYDTIYRKHGIEIHYSTDVIKYLIDENGDNKTIAGGGRGVKRLIERDITAPVASFINANPNVKHIGITTSGYARVDDKTRLRSEMRIEVGQYKSVPKQDFGYQTSGVGGLF